MPSILSEREGYFRLVLFRSISDFLLLDKDMLSTKVLRQHIASRPVQVSVSPILSLIKARLCALILTPVCQP